MDFGAGGYREPRLAREHFVGPVLVGWIIGGDAPFAALSKDPRDFIDQFRMHKAALGVPGFGPGIWKHQE